jgi:hypothetical protein
MEFEEKAIMKAVVICFKEWLKSEEIYLYTNLEKTEFSKKAKEYGITPNKNGYYSRKDLDLILTGGPTKFEIAAAKLNLPIEDMFNKKG